MLPQILPKTKFAAFVRQLMAGARVAAPLAKGHQYVFGVLEGP